MAIKFDELLEALDPSLDKFEEDLDSMWIIIPTERRYDDLSTSDYDEFINKYGTFNSRQECWDKIDKLAPDRWDAFIPMRIEGVNEAYETDVEIEAKPGDSYYTGNDGVKAKPGDPYYTGDKIESKSEDLCFESLNEDFSEDNIDYIGKRLSRHIRRNGWDSFFDYPALAVRDNSGNNRHFVVKSNKNYIIITDEDYKPIYSHELNSNNGLKTIVNEAAKEIINNVKRFKIVHVNESLNESMTKEELQTKKYIDVQQHIDSVINFLADHEQAWEDCCNYFKLNPDDEDALYQIDPAELEDWIWDHRGLYHDLERYLSEGLNEDFDSESHISKVSFDIQYVGDGDEDDAIDRIEEIINGFEWELENNYNDIELLGSDVENMTEVYQQQYSSLDEALSNNNILGPYSKYYKFIGSNAGFDDYMDDVLEVVEGNYGMQFIGWAEAKPKYYDRLMDDGYDYVLVVKDPEKDNIQLVTWLDDRLYPVELEDMMYESYKRINESIDPGLIKKRKKELIDYIWKFQQDMSGMNREDDIKYGLTGEQVEMLDNIINSLSDSL